MFLKIQKILMDSVEGDASPSGYGAETTTTATTTETAQTQGDTSNGTQGDTSTAGAADKTATTGDKSKQTSTPIS